MRGTPLVVKLWLALVGLVVAVLGVITFAVVVLVPNSARAQDAGLGEAYGEQFLQYRPYVIPGKKPAETAKPAAPPAAAPPAAPDKASKVDVAWLRKSYPLLEERAIDDPTPTNVGAYLYVRRVIMDKAQRFGEAVIEVTRRDPLLDENNRIPYASAGAQSIRNANYLAEQEAVRELGRVGGLLVFVDGACRFCAAQLPIVSMVRRNYGMEYLVISTDGANPKGYPGRAMADNGLFRKLGLKLTPSIVFVPRPTGYAAQEDPNRYLVISQGFYAEDQLVKQIAFAGHETSLLSKATMADLNVWDRGVAATEDLGALRLDANDPASIQSTLQPLLLKQYGGGQP